MDLAIIAVAVSFFSLIMAITAFIFSFSSGNSIKSSILADLTSQKLIIDASKVEIDLLRTDVNAFNRDSYKKLGDKYNILEVEIQSISNKVDASETARKNWGNKWAPILGKFKKDVDLAEDEIESTPDTIPIPGDVVNHSEYRPELPPEQPPKRGGFASLIGS